MDFVLKKLNRVTIQTGDLFLGIYPRNKNLGWHETPCTTVHSIQVYTSEIKKWQQLNGHCPSFTSIAMIKIHNKKQLRERGVYFTLQLQSITVEKSRQEWLTASPTMSIVKSREYECMLLLACFYFSTFTTVQEPLLENGAIHIRLSLPTITNLRQSPKRCAHWWTWCR